MDGRLAASMWVDSKEVVNHGPRPVPLQFRDSQRYDFLIRNVQGQEGVALVSRPAIYANARPGNSATRRRETHLSRVTPATLRRGSYTVTGVVPVVDVQWSARLNVTMR
jgi:Intracellular proteinase inhibitor